jgi:4-amino-4-deoxy-L-arabinose transferase-like glycosyltransferase
MVTGLKRVGLTEQDLLSETSTVTRSDISGSFETPETNGRRSSRRVRLAIGLLGLVLSGAAALPFFFMGRPADPLRKVEPQMPVTHDMHLHFEQMKSFYSGLSSGLIYPRWEEDTNRHFGAPTTSYYPPGIYYLTSTFFAIFGDWWLTLLSTYWIMMAGSAAAIYLYARQTMSRPAASVAMGAYIFLPYHILDQYQRGAMAELLGFVWMPLMMLFGERMFRKSKSIAGERGVEGSLESDTQSSRSLNMAGLATVYGAFLWSHPPTAYQFTLAFGILALILAARRRDLKGLISTGVAMAMGTALSGAYLVSAAVEEDLIRHEYVSENWPYHTTYVFLHDLPYRAPHMGFFNLIDATWIAYTVGIVVMVGALAAFGRRTRLISGELAARVVLWTVMGCFAAFMMTTVSYYLGGMYIPKIEIGVFTWRMLSMSTLVVALLAGACVEAAAGSWRQKRRAAFWSITAAWLLAACGGIAVSMVMVVGPMYLAPAFQPSFEHLNLAMIPRTAPEDPLQLPHLDEVDLIEGNGSVIVERWEPESRALWAVLFKGDRLLVRTFDFPGWTARVDGEPSQIITGPEIGEIALELPAGSHTIELEYLSTPARRAGNSMSVVSFLAVSLMALVPLVAPKRARATGDT